MPRTLSHWCSDANLVELLHRSTTQVGRICTSRDVDHRRLRMQGIRKSANRIRMSRSRGQRNGPTPKNPRIRVGSVNRRRLVPRVDHPKRMVNQHIEHMQNVVASYTEERVYALGTQRGNQEVTSRDRLTRHIRYHSFASSSCNRSMNSSARRPSNFSGSANASSTLEA